MFVIFVKQILVSRMSQSSSAQFVNNFSLCLSATPGGKKVEFRVLLLFKGKAREVP